MSDQRELQPLRQAGAVPVSPYRAKFSGKLGKELWSLALLPCLAYLVVPIAALFFYENPAKILANLDQRQVAESIGLSSVTTITTTLIAILIGTPVAYLLPRLTGWRHRLIETIVDLPVVLPPAVAGIALLLAFGTRGLLGHVLQLMGISIPFSTAAVVFAQLFVASPYYIKTAAVGFAAVDPSAKEAASIDGATRFETFLRISLPLTRNALLGEFGATIIFAGNLPGRTQTMPLAIYIGFQLNLDVAIALSILLVAVSFIVMFVTRMLLASGDEP